MSNAQKIKMALAYKGLKEAELVICLELLSRLLTKG